MKMERLVIRKRSEGYGPSKREYYVCNVEFEGETSKHELTLDDALSARVMALVAQELRDHAETLASCIIHDLSAAAPGGADAAAAKETP